MKVLCIDNRFVGGSCQCQACVQTRLRRFASGYSESLYDITIGKWYDILTILDNQSQGYNGYIITNDVGTNQFYSRSLFKNQKEIRKEKLEKLSYI